MYYVQLDIHLFTHRDDVRYSWCNKIGNNLPCWLNHLMRRFLKLSVDEIDLAISTLIVQGCG